MTPLFDAYVAVDWSAESRPKTGADSVWFCVHGEPPQNPPTRREAFARLRALLVGHVRAERRVLVGFDFPYGYPAGFADAVAPGDGPAWRRVWTLLSSRVVDEERNRNNRFEVAAELNARTGGPGPFWAAPASRATAALTQKRTIAFPYRGLAELRAVDRLERGLQSAWKLGGAGSVGSQALVGIPYVAALRDDPALAAVSRIWPFETGFAVPDGDARVVHAEIWPGLVEPAPGDAPRDARQVAALVRRWAELDAAGRLAPLFAPAAPAAAADEEGWILGAGVAAAAPPPLAFAAIAPHGDVADAPELHAAMQELGRRFAAADPQTAIVLTPHNVHVEGHFGVVTAARVGELACDRELAAAVLAELRADGIPAAGVSYGGNDPAEAEMPLDWGTEVPLSFLRAERVVVVTPARDRPLDEHVRAGGALARASAGRRVALVASADHGHAHDPDGPYGFHEAAARYDALFRELVRTGGGFHGLAELVGDAKADSLWQLLMLEGALGGPRAGELLGYAAPTYYGMACVAYP